MNDELHPHLELASALLDGQLDADARADADVTALADTLRELRAELSDVPAPSAARREQALAAALAEFDAGLDAGLDTGLAAAAAAPAAARESTVLSFFRRRAPLLMGAAAAVVLAGVVGITALNGGDDDDSAATRATEQSDGKEFAVANDSAGGSESASEESVPVGAGDAPPSTIGGITGPAVAAYMVSTPEELLGIAMLVVSDGVDLRPASPDSAAPASTTVPLSTDAPMVEATSAWPGFTCPLTPSQVVLADIIWVDTPAVAVLDTSTGVVSAIDEACTVLVTAAP